MVTETETETASSSAIPPTDVVMSTLVRNTVGPGANPAPAVRRDPSTTQLSGRLKRCHRRDRWPLFDALRLGIGLTLLSLYHGACVTETTGGASWSVRDSAGVALVVADVPQGNEVSERILHRLPDFPASFEFGRISGLAVESDGRLVILDALARTLYRINHDGLVVDTIARSGEGPGELGNALNSLAIGPNDTVFVPDYGNGRINMYWHGEFAGQLSMPPMVGVRRTAWGVLPNGDLVFRFLRQSESVAGVARVRRNTLSIDTLLLHELADKGNTGAFAFILLASLPVMTVGGNGDILVGMTESAETRMYAPSGEIRRIIRLPQQRAVLTRDDRETIGHLFRRKYSELGQPEEMADIFTILTEDSLPAFVSVVGAPNGDYWLEYIERLELVHPLGLDVGTLAGTGTGMWDVFSAEGRWRERVRLPRGLRYVVVTPDRVYGIDRGESNEDRLAVWAR